MKKAIFLALLILTTIFNGYSQENLANIILGKWKVDSLMFNLDQENIFILTNLSDPNIFSVESLIYTFKRDGTGGFTSENASSDFSIPFTWKVFMDKETPRAYMVINWKSETSDIFARLYFADLSTDPNRMIVYMQYEEGNTFRVNTFQYLK